jgi:nucleoside phosphorylase
MTDARVPAYLSHSYRARDRGVSEFFWNLLWQADFTGSVDRKSRIFSAPHVEMLIQRSSCFVAIVSYRDEQPYYRCSPFIVYEHDLAVRADKKRLVFVEAGVSARPFRDSSTTCAFDRENLDEQTASFVKHMSKLRSTVLPSDFKPTLLLGKIGLLIDGDEKDAISARLSSLIEVHGYQPVPLRPNPTLAEFTRDLNELDIVIVDVTPDVLPDWVHPYLLGKFMPTLALLRLRDMAGPDTLSPLLTANMMPSIPISDGPMVMWRDLEELEASVDRHLLRLRTGRRRVFPTLEAGRVYFRSLGRGARRVFVSNFNDANSLAREVCREFDRHGIDYYHYKYHQTIAIGKDWQSGLKEEVNKCDIFVALITPEYWNSQWARGEFETALNLARKDALDIIPYFIAGDVAPVDEQGRDMRDATDQERVNTIVADVDNLMTAEEADSSHQEVETIHRDEEVKTGKAKRTSARPKAVDIAIVTIKREEYAAVLRHLESPENPDLGRKRNRFAWHVGRVRSQLEAKYTVVVAMAGTAGTNVAQSAVHATVEVFHPRYVLVVGIAGGLVSEKERNGPVDSWPMRKGDVVVSSVIYGYEYGKVDEGGFIPRHDLTYQVDSPILRAADILPIIDSKWSDSLQVERPASTVHAPRVHTAPVASGDKVVDDPSADFFKAVWDSWPKLRAVEMEGAGAAAAVKDIVDSGKPLGLAMIRGISDIPTAPGDRGEESAGQTAERDQWTEYASETAATFTVQLISKAWPEGPRTSN